MRKPRQELSIVIFLQSIFAPFPKHSYSLFSCVNGENLKASISGLVPKENQCDLFVGWGRGLNQHRLVGALGLGHTQLWVPDTCYPVLMWLVCETVASMVLYKGQCLWWFGNYSQQQKFQILKLVRTNLQTSSSEQIV